MWIVEAPGPTGELLSKLQGLSAGGVRRIPGGAVECVDIRRNAGGESVSLADH